MKSNQKITIQELIDLLCEKTSANKQQAEDFIKSLFAVIEEQLLAGEQVKINDFGVFKLQWNEPRKSVNINTGEEFIIDGFNKLSFVPEPKLKDAVNEPFAHLESIILDGEKKTDPAPNDPLRTLQEQATAIKGILSEISSMSEEEPRVKSQESRQEMNSKFKVEEVEVKEEEEEIIVINEDNTEAEVVEPEIEVISEEEIKLEVTENEDVEENIQQENIKLEKPEEPGKIIEQLEEEPEEIEPEGNKKSWKKLLWLWILLLIIAIIAGTAITYFSSSCLQCWVKYDLLNETQRQKLSTIENTVNSWLPTKTKNANSIAEIPETIIAVDSIPENKIDSVFDNKADSIPAEIENVVKVENINESQNTNENKNTVQNQNINQNQSQNSDDLESLFNEPRVYQVFVTTETIRKGVYLTTLSLEHYGDKDFWVYIYEANCAKYKNPDAIPVGAKIKIPKMDNRLIDCNNPQCKAKARELQSKYLKR